MEVELATEIAREQYLKNVIDQVRDEYEFIVLDCPPSLGILTLNALCAATELLIPLQCEFFALEGIAKLLDTYTKVKQKLNPQLAILGILLTMFDQRNRISRDVREDVKSKMPGLSAQHHHSPQCQAFRSAKLRKVDHLLRHQIQGCAGLPAARPGSCRTEGHLVFPGGGSELRHHFVLEMLLPDGAAALGAVEHQKAAHIGV